MFHPKQMSRLLIVASKEQLEPVITELYRMNIFHIDDFVDKGDEQWEGFRIGMPLTFVNKMVTKTGEIRVAYCHP